MSNAFSLSAPLAQCVKHRSSNQTLTGSNLSAYPLFLSFFFFIYLFIFFFFIFFFFVIIISFFSFFLYSFLFFLFMESI